jgi:type II secretory pathway pseudopilin PulG
MNKGFTLVELMVSVGIFIFMTVLLIVRFGNFNQSVLLTNMAYDVALVMRTAQTFGVSVKSSSETSAIFQAPYGVNFSTITSVGGAKDPLNSRIILFTDTYPLIGPNGIYNYESGSSDDVKQGYNLARGATVSKICTGPSETNCTDLGSQATLSVTFKRPDPKAIICGMANGMTSCTPANYAIITIKGTDSSERYVAVSQNGQISILQ